MSIFSFRFFRTTEALYMDYLLGTKTFKVAQNSSQHLDFDGLL